MSALVFAAAVPVAATTSAPRWLIGVLGALSVAAQGAQRIGRYREMAAYQFALAGAMQREVALYRAQVGDYEQLDAQSAFRLLVQRIEDAQRDSDRGVIETMRSSGADDADGGDIAAKPSQRD
jgi:hypothetical protein